MKTSKHSGPERESGLLETSGRATPSPEKILKHPERVSSRFPAARVAVESAALGTKRGKEIPGPQSEFFHDASAFEVIQRFVLPELRQRRKLANAPIRVWVPGCSSGAEVYSIAVVLLEFMQEQPSVAAGTSTAIEGVQIFGSETNEVALDRARSGLYSEAALANVSPQRLKKFFASIHGGYQIRPFVREMCLFARHDLAKDPPFSNLDLILCRGLQNYQDYLAPDSQAQVIPTMHYALKPNGYLMLDAASSLGPFARYFDVVDDKYKLYQKRETEKRLVPGALGWVGGPRRAGEPPITRSTAVVFDSEKEIERLLVKRRLPACIVVNGEMEVIRRRGTSRDGTEGLRKLHRSLGDGFLRDLRFALNQAKKEGKTVRKEGVDVKLTRGRLKLDLEVIPVGGDHSGEPHYVIMFREPAQETDSALESKSAPRSRTEEIFIFRENTRLARGNTYLKEQLGSMAQEHETFVEELQTANEELSSANEEFQSANEELETARQELQSINEELTSVNRELQSRNMELSIAYNDFQNLLGNVPIPWVLVGSDLRVRRFTPLAQILMNLTPDSIGKRLGETGTNLDDKDLQRLVREVVSTHTQHEREIRDKNGKWHMLRVWPYKTWDSKLDGGVISFQDINTLKRTVDQARNYAEVLFENAKEAIVLLDGTLQFAGANPAFCRTFRVRPEEMESLSFDQFNGGQWDISNLRSLLNETLIHGSRVDDFEMSLELPQMGQRFMVLDARRIEPQPEHPLILLAIEDVTEKRKYVEDLRRHAALLELANDAVIVRDLEGRIYFWNRGAEELYGWKKEDALGKFKQELLQPKFPKPLKEIHAEMARRGRWEGELEHACRDGSKRIVRGHWALQREGGSAMVLEINSDVTDKKQTEESLRRLSSRLMHVQDEERRRIARELHDSTGQKLMALKMTLQTLVKRNPKFQREPAVSECIGLIDEGAREIRTLAQLLHPPLLDEAGLPVATRWLVDGFSKRSGIVIDLLLPADLGRLPENTEIALFRIIQEALNNIHQHSGANRVSIEITRTASAITLQVRDNGKGMQGILDTGSTNATPVFGVGIEGMKERLSELKGTLEIVSGENGTTITANVPNQLEQS